MTPIVRLFFAGIEIRLGKGGKIFKIFRWLPILIVWRSFAVLKASPDWKEFMPRIEEESAWVRGPVIPPQVDIHLSIYADVAGAADELAVSERCSVSRLVGDLIEGEYRRRWPKRIPVSAEERKPMWNQRRLGKSRTR